MREKLDRDNLHVDLPQRAARSASSPTGSSRPPGVTHFRTADGSWNNLDDPKEGAAGTRFPRNVANAAIAPADDERAAHPPTRALISRKLLDPRRRRWPRSRSSTCSRRRWIQFQNHDWINHGDNVDHRA